ncbi:hypothetical protein [Photobacterium galatheae]|uniref:Outer membrane protein beta-barrel domain-containing protein n=1 Tax=Photobacterium galatheae TaxID=1654360 RepID=A0A066RP85_9GAMM|nr:hypothetical protein [Photobacterium galatheae]KDM90941.1 hypothetical protein EA58_14390 [Photobacterium galatheae]MCM0149095.1 hypothetical protein [Photobacterium galatheae]
MNKKLSLIALSVLFSSSPFAYEAKTYSEAHGQAPSEESTSIKMGESIQGPSRDLDKFSPDIISSYATVRYMGVNEHAESRGFEVELGASIKDVEFSVAYRDHETELDHAGVKTEEQIEQIRAKFLVPLITSDDYVIQAGVRYARTASDIKLIENDSFFGTVKINGQLSDSIVGYAAADFEVSDEDPIIDGKIYDVHDDMTYRFGLDYYATQNLAMGVNIAFGSELDSVYSLGASYKF